MRTTRPRSAGERERLPPGVLNQRWVPVKSGAAPRSGSEAFGRAARPGAACGRESNFGAPRRSSSRSLHRVGASPARAVSVERRRCAAPARSRSGCRGRRRRRAPVSTMTAPSTRWTRTAAGAAHAAPRTRRPPSAIAQQHERGAGDVGDRDRDRPPRRGRDGDHRGEDRAGARRVDEPQRAAHEQPRAEAVARAARAEAAEAPRAGAPARSARPGASAATPAMSSTAMPEVAQRRAAEAEVAEQLAAADDRDQERQPRGPGRSPAAAAGRRPRRRRAAPGGPAARTG